MTYRTVLVTGGTRGIGAIIAQTLKSKGYDVIANYHSNKEAAEQFSKDHDIPAYAWDVSDPVACLTGHQTVSQNHGNIDILIHNAGITRDALLHKMTVDMWDDVIRTNLSSCFYMTQRVLPKMQEQQFGRLVFLSSVNGVKGQRGQTNYSAAKAGILGFVKALAQENAQNGITVNAIAPGYTDTDMVRQVPEKVMERILGQIPAGRLADPSEIARTAAFLIDDEAGYITGQTLHINGGLYM